MCLLVDIDAKPQITKENMTVYKVVKPNMSALTRGFSYKENQSYNTEIMESDHPGVADDLAVKAAREKYGYDWRFGSLTKFLGRGFHSCLTLARAKKLKEIYEPCQIRRATIPKGSQYYTDTSDLCISNQIIIHEGTDEYELFNSEGRGEAEGVHTVAP